LKNKISELDSALSNLMAKRQDLETKVNLLSEENSKLNQSMIELNNGFHNARAENAKLETTTAS